MAEAKLESPYYKKYQHVVNEMAEFLNREKEPESTGVHKASSLHIVMRIQVALITLVHRYGKIIRTLCFVGLLACYAVYLAFSIKYSLDGAVVLIVVTSLVVAAVVYGYIKNRFGDRIYQTVCVPLGKWLNHQWHWLKWIVYCGIILGIIYYLAFAIITTRRQLRSLLGMALFIALPFLTCKHPNKINWRPVLWGLALQFLIGVLVLRWKPGYDAVKWLSQVLNKILSYSLAGSAQVFGDPLFFIHGFFMLVIPLVIYLGSLLGIMYYVGITQWFCGKMGYLMSFTLQTTAIESVCLAANIFLSVLDIVLMLRPFIPLLTDSEFHTFLVGSHSTIAGFAFGIIVLFGVRAQHLLTGAVMSAPAAVAIGKLNFPETQVSQLKDPEILGMSSSPDHNIFDACVNGAWLAAKSAVSILVQVMAFMGLYYLCDGLVVYFGELVGIDIQLHTLVGYLFIPLAWLMGIDEEDLVEVSSMLGLKVLANEFLGFFLLGRAVRLKTISERSSTIATYAMCGFSSLGTLAIFLGVWNTIDANRTGQVARIIPRILMNSNVACFMTASIAAVFYDENIAFEDETDPPLIAELVFRFLISIPGVEDFAEALGLTWSQQ